MKEQKEWTDAAGEREGNWNFRALYFPPTLPLPFPLLPNSSPSALDLRSFTMRGAALFSSVMNGRYTCYGGYISRTRRHCNFPRHRHRYHELVIDAFHYSRGDDSTETAAYRSSGGGERRRRRELSLHARLSFILYSTTVGRFLKGRPRFESIELVTGGGGEWRRGREKENRRKWNVETCAGARAIIYGVCGMGWK